MTAQRVDYDSTTLPDAYDCARDHGPVIRDLWMGTVEGAVRGRGAIRRVVDLGCGTGRFTNGLAERFDATVLGVDPSRRMLAVALGKPRGTDVRYAVARGEELPLPDASVDLVFASMVFHHFAAPERVARECRRVLRADGIVFLRAGTAERSPTYPYVPFLPAALPLLRAVLPTCAQLCAPFEAAGFRTVVQDVLPQQIAPTHAVYADKLEAGGDSVLMRLPSEELSAGLADLRAHSRTVDPEPVVEQIDYFVFA
jgi:ubiquinone/menaquinone biosynthesis C-methylase UbiE